MLMVLWLKVFWCMTWSMGLFLLCRIVLIGGPDIQELSKVHEFEEMFDAASQAQASKLGRPPVTLDDLAPTMDPVGEHTISAAEVKWIMKAAKESADHIKKTDPRYKDPYSTEEFQKEQVRVAEQLGIPPDQLAELQSKMTPEKWKAVHAS